MFSGPLLLLVALAYLGILFAIAWFGDRRARPLTPRLRVLVYSLALGVYCTSWTFYGAVGNAAAAGWAFLPIYLGPIVLFLFGSGMLRRLLAVAKARNLTSIADFLASRFGRSQSLAGLVTVVALTAAIPYLALQFKAVALSVDVLTGSGSASAKIWYTDTAFFTAIVLAIFSILFGTRVVDATEHHRGLMLAIAAESVVKLVAFLAVGVLALGLSDRFDADAAFVVPVAVTQFATSDFIASTLLSLCAIFCLPRQFQVAVVECEEPQDLRSARWLFPFYLALFVLFVLPIAQAGLRLAPASVNPDTYVLWLPLSQGQEWLALLTFVGGFSAATGMVIVASVALATMVSNELILPALSRVPALRMDSRSDLSRWVLWIRRGTILMLAAIAFAYYRASVGRGNLASLGLLAFVAVSQFAPGMVFGLYSRRISLRGVRLGLGIGFAVWIYTLLLPTLAGSGWMSGQWVQDGPLGLAWLRPHALLGLDGWSPITHGAFWSLGANLLTIGLQRLFRPASMEERLQARVFLDGPLAPGEAAEVSLPQRARVGDVLALGERILGEGNWQRLLQDYQSQVATRLKTDQIADRALVRFVERQLAAALGATSARLVLTGALRGTGMEFEEVASLLDETSQELRFNQRLLHTTMENVGQGISVVDADLHLVAWNRRYVELFNYPDGLVHVGCPVADLIRYNATRGEWGEGDPEGHVQKRLDYLRQGSPYVFQRRRASGQVLEMRGQPLPGGGFVTTYSDITSFKEVEQALLEAKEHLEQRVAARTEELQHALAAQQIAQQAAESANRSKTRFIAAAGHDLLQPLHAARLFMSSLQDQGELNPRARALADQVDAGMRAAEELLDGLLDISRLDSGVMVADKMPLALAPMFESLRAQFAPLAAARGLRLRVVATKLGVTSDRRLLRRVLQNLLANAIRYTAQGGVLLGVRRRAGGLAEIQVIDTGPGIAAEHRALIFEEFQRIDVPNRDGQQGLGLGLAICDRIARLLQHPLRLHSVPGSGSRFTVTANICEAPATPAAEPKSAPSDLPAGLHVLCLDNEPSILEAMGSLLTGWGLSTDLALSLLDAQAAVARRAPDLVLADYHLQSDVDGLEALRLLCVDGRPGALVTADSSAALAERAKALGYPVLRKPVRPAALRALIGQLGKSARPA
jgi:Na+/proline symporter/signal transduction histidine kinase